MTIHERITQNYIAKLKPKDKLYDIYDIQIPGLFLRVETSGKINWHLRYGKRTAKIGPAEILNPGQARDIAQNFLAELYITGVSPKDKSKQEEAEKNDNAAQCGTIGELLEQYDAAGTSKYIRKRINTHFSYDTKIDSITLLWADKWRKDYIAQGHKIASGNRAVSALRTLLNWGNERNLTNNETLHKLKMLPETDSKQIERYLTEEEIKRFFKELENAEPIFQSFIKIAYNTGIRKRALLNLKWEDVNLSERTLWLRANTAKSKKEFLIPINKTVAAELEKIPHIGEYIFYNPEKKAHYYDFKKPWEKLLRDARIKDFRFHDLRHNFASMLINKHADMATISKLLTHSNTKMTERYAHLAPSRMKEAVDLLDGE